MTTWRGKNDYVPEIGGTVIKASAAITATTADTPVELGKGLFRIDIITTAFDITSSQEQYTFDIECNTDLSYSDWTRIGTTTFGCFEATGRGTDDVTGTHRIYVYNPSNLHVRSHVYVIGSTPTVTYSIKAFPVYNTDIS